MGDAGAMRRLQITGPGTELAGPSELEARFDHHVLSLRIDADGTPARIYLAAKQCRDLAGFLASVADEIESGEQG